VKRDQDESSKHRPKNRFHLNYKEEEKKKSGEKRKKKEETRQQEKIKQKNRQDRQKEN